MARPVRPACRLLGLLLVVWGAGCGDEPVATKERGTPPPVVASGAGRARTASPLGLTRNHPPAYRRVCEEQARYAPRDATTCPPVIPRGKLEVIDAGPLFVPDRGGYSADFASRSLDRIRGRRVNANGGHWRYDVAWTKQAKHFVVELRVLRPQRADRPSRCKWREIDNRRMRACRVVPHEKGGGLNGGHFAYVWRHTGVVYIVSVHGYRNAPRARAMIAALADAVGRR